MLTDALHGRTAIRTAATEADTTLTSPIAAPPYPDHPSGLSGIGCSVAESLQYFFGRDAATFSGTTQANVTRTFHSFPQLQISSPLPLLPRNAPPLFVRPLPLGAPPPIFTPPLLFSPHGGRGAIRWKAAARWPVWWGMAITDPRPVGVARSAHRLLGLEIRPIAADDKAALVDFFARLSPRSRYRRFFSSKPSLSPRELAYFTEVDHRCHVGLVAVDESLAVVGLAQYAGWSGGAGGGELAVAIADSCHRRGIGTLIGRRLIERARENGVDHLTATTQADNLPCQRLLRRLGFLPLGRIDGLIEFQLSL